MGVKRRCITLLHELGVTVSQITLAKIHKELEEVGRVCDFTLDNFNKVARALQCNIIVTSLQIKIKSVASQSRNQLTIVYDNFDWNERVQHETTSKAHKHISATISKLILNPKFPLGGLYTHILKPTVNLTRSAIFNHPGNQVDHHTEQCRQHWIAEAIAYALLKVNVDQDRILLPFLVMFYHQFPLSIHYQIPTGWRCRQWQLQAQWSASPSTFCHLSSVYNEALEPLAIRQNLPHLLLICARTTNQQL